MLNPISSPTYRRDLSGTDLNSIQDITRQIQDSITSTLSQTFGATSSSGSIASFFDSLTDSFTRITQDAIELLTYQQQIGSAGRKKSESRGQTQSTTQTVTQPITTAQANTKTKTTTTGQTESQSRIRTRASSGSSSKTQTVSSGTDTTVALKYGGIVIKSYQNDYDINQSGQVGNPDNWQDDIDISAGQHDYDYDNDGAIDGKSSDISQLTSSLIKNRSFEQAESQIASQLGLNFANGTQVDFHFSDRLFPTSASADGVTGVTVSTSNPAIIMDLDEIMIKKNGVDQKVIVHEMTHAMMYSQLDSDNQPAWFMEGAAVYAANQGDEKIASALQTGSWNLKSLEEINNSSGFGITNYAESYMAFKYIESFYGQDKIKEL
ncbi:MAG: hypothetical protein KBA26_10805, partial [Candidatus Delongbacteria bacterium]|nr:hypothetical protein [Candidatus Delongbacteria bacterium]